MSPRPPPLTLSRGTDLRVGWRGGPRKARGRVDDGAVHRGPRMDGGGAPPWARDPAGARDGGDVYNDRQARLDVHRGHEAASRWDEGDFGRLGTTELSAAPGDEEDDEEEDEEDRESGGQGGGVPQHALWERRKNSPSLRFQL